MKILQEHDRVRYMAGNRKMHGVIADVLPFHPQRFVPVQKRTKIVWMDRKNVRKLPDKNHEKDNI